jgi:hypothetical protein
MLHGERLGNETTHRPSEQTYPFDAEHLNHSRGIIGELGNIKWLSVVCGVTDSAIVEEDELIGGSEPVDKGRIPVRTCRGETIQDDKRPAVPNSTISDLGPIDLEFLEQRLIGHRRR